MARVVWTLSACGLCVALLSGAACPRAFTPVASLRATSPFVRGVGLGLFASDPDWDYGALLDEIVAVGATDVLLVVVWYQENKNASDIAPRKGFSPSIEAIERTLKQAAHRGLRVSFMPIVRLTTRAPDEWRGRIAPTAGVEAWFASYRRYILTMAEVAERGQAIRFSVGSELLSLERHEASWRALIGDVRQRFSGRLLYSANWDHFDPVRFWDALDEVGITAYFELARDDERPDKTTLEQAWLPAMRQLSELRTRVGRPVLITEVGYPSKTTAARAPWDETRSAPVDLALQADLYDAFCDAFRKGQVVDGFFFWNWFGFGGPTDGDYTPRGKPAAARLARCLAAPDWRSPP